MTNDQWVVVNGIRIRSDALTMIIRGFTDPDPQRWYRFERDGDVIHVETKVIEP